MAGVALAAGVDWMATEGGRDGRQEVVRDVGFRDREEAGRRLAEVLGARPWTSPVVLALPRGGVPVAAPVADALRAPLDVVVARKVGAPGQPELGIGAIAEGGIVVADPHHWRGLGLDDARFAELARVEATELDRRVARYRGDRMLPALVGRDVLVIDDGLATGVTAEAAVRAVRRFAPRRVVLAVPVCAAEAVARLARVADEVVCLETPPRFRAVGLHYAGFDPTTDAEVLDLLERAPGDARRP